AVYTTDIDEATEIFSKRTTPTRLELLTRRARFEWRANVASLVPIVLTAHAYGDAFQANTELVENIFTTAFPLVDVEASALDAGTVLPVGKDKATWLASPNRPGGFRVAARYRSLSLTVHQADMEAALAALSGAPSTTALRFEPRLSLS